MAKDSMSKAIANKLDMLLSDVDLVKDAMGIDQDSVNDNDADNASPIQAKPDQNQPEPGKETDLAPAVADQQQNSLQPQSAGAALGKMGPLKKAQASMNSKY